MTKKENERKKIVILRQNGGRLGNQLLLFASVYAFCLENGFECINYSFYNYRNYFQLPSDWFSNLVDCVLKIKFYKSHASYLIIYQTYKLLTYVYTLFIRGKLVKEDPISTIFLLPSIDKNKIHKKIIKDIISSSEKVIYLDGWHFRNPTGIKKYHKQIVNLIKPDEKITKKVESFIKPLKKDFYLVGVHIRQGDYKRMMGGEWYFTDKEVVTILKKFQGTKQKSKPILFILCSDGPINLKLYQGLNVKLGIGKLMEDFFTLASCNTVIGSNSTFGEMAAYFGNIPFTVFKK